MKEAFRPIETAPLTGKAVRLLLKDGYGTFPFQPCGWCMKKKVWINAKSGAKIIPVPVGWLPLARHVEIDYAS